MCGLDLFVCGGGKKNRRRRRRVRTREGRTIGGGPQRITKEKQIAADLMLLTRLLVISCSNYLIKGGK